MNGFVNRLGKVGLGLIIMSLISSSLNVKVDMLLIVSGITTRHIALRDKLAP